MGRARVLLADDHAETLRCWHTLLEPEFEIVGSVRDGHALVEAYDLLSPDVVVTDVAMPLLTGLVAAETIRRHDPAARIVFATVHADRMMLRRGLAAGAYGYVLKFRAGEDLATAVRAAVHGEIHISPFPPLAISPDVA